MLATPLAAASTAVAVAVAEAAGAGAVSACKSVSAKPAAVGRPPKAAKQPVAPAVVRPPAEPTYSKRGRLRTMSQIASEGDQGGEDDVTK